MNQKGFANIIWVVVIVAVLVGAAGDFAFVKNSEPIAQQPTPTFTQTNTPVSSTPTPKNETANWAEYSNTKYNYFFRYPKDFTIYAATEQTKEEVILPTATSDKVSLTDKKAMLFCREPLV